ncbi:thymidylate kinase [Krasilnikovia cinnamomea]|uniref:Thymidylate kinase n=2 Tax=Krasilnikovia cinnamomea TaxID=349313 RepID=A0A4Q7ZQ08_9ACTN|nr:thymidylate kinase [Krasilnikovia cinnamomea]
MGMVPDRAFSRRRRLRTVALVGIDGSGKTTQARLLADTLRARGLRATYRRNAGGRRWFGRLATAFGRRDAEDLLGRRLMLFVESLLRWLAILDTRLRRRLTGDIAVMDRYAVCQYASLRARGCGPRAERRARLAYRLFPKPDVTFLLAVDPAVAYDRIEARGYDHEEMAFLRAAAAAYRSLPEHDDFVVVDANRSPAEVAAALSAALDAWQDRPASAPRLPAVMAGTRAVVLAAGPLAAGAAVVGRQLTDVL